MSSKSILSSANTVNYGADDVENSCAVSDVNSENSENVPSNCCSLPEKPYHPKTKFGSRNRSCQHNWFDNFHGCIMILIKIVYIFCFIA